MATTTTITTTNTNTSINRSYNASSPSSATSPVPVPVPVALPLPLPLPTPRPSAPARHRPISPNGPPLACSPAPAPAPASAPTQSQPPRAPLPSQPRPFLATAVIATAPAPPPALVTPKPTAAAPPVKPEPVPIVRISAIPSPDGGKMNMTAAAAASTQGPKMSMTSKEWVIPPRPKPGRKPATDTPPTKRKAQNRAAQRAFRERRAARVGELEEQLDQYKQEYDKKELDLKDQIHSLELDVQSFRSRCLLLENMLERERQDRIRVETEAETLRRRHSEQQVLQNQCIASASSPHHAHNYRHDNLQHRQSVSRSNNRLPHPGGTSRDFAISQMITPPESMDSQQQQQQQQDVAAPLADSDITCGNCSPDGHCACAEEVLAATVGGGCGTCAFGGPCKCIEDMGDKNMTPVNGLKRPLSGLTNAAPPATGKRARSLSGRRMAAAASSSADDETDFIGEFSRYPSQTQLSTPLTVQQDPPPSSEMMMMMMMMQSSSSSSSSTDSIPFKDGCVFCKDGTYCACADAAMATPAMTPPETQPRMPCQVQTPPPSETDVVSSQQQQQQQQQPLIMEMTADGAVKLPPRKAKMGKPLGGGGGSCGTGAPGTCAQCQADPKSGLFCRLMNAKFGKEQTGTCCGGKGGGGSSACCKSKSANGGSSSSGNGGKEDERITLPSLPSLGLSCAEAYQTLSSHRNFSQAANDIGSWLPKLKATSRAMPLTLSTSPGSSPRHNSRGMMPIEVEAASIMSVLKEFDIRFGREC